MIKRKTVTRVRFLYLLAAFFWLLLISWICYDDIWDIVILFLPFVIFAINYYYVPWVEEPTEDMIKRISIIGASLLIALPILTWTRDSCKSHRRQFFFKIIAMALIFAILAVIDFWVPACEMIIVRRLKSIFETYAAVLFIYGVYRFYIEQE